MTAASFDPSRFLSAGGPCTCVHATPLVPGAIAVLSLHGDVLPVLAALTGRRSWPTGRLALVSLGDVDEGLAGRLDRERAEVMPHGGPRVVQRLLERLAGLGVRLAAAAEVDPVALYPEARDRTEALVLPALARARSPLAIDLLLDQARRWRTRDAVAAWTNEDEARSRRLCRLLEPPVVVLAGPPNVGKSTLSNALLGRSMSIALDAPGTTRDYTSGLIDLAGLVVAWHDTPGLPETGSDAADEVERRAIALAENLMRRADALIAVTDQAHGWPRLSRPPDLRLALKGDLGGREDADLVVSALRGTGLADLARTVRDLLVPPPDLEHPGPWRFDDRMPPG